MKKEEVKKLINDAVRDVKNDILEQATSGEIIQASILNTVIDVLEGEIIKKLDEREEF